MEDALLENLDHAVIDLDGYDLVRGFEELEGEVAGAGSDFEDRVGGVYRGSPKDGVQNSRVDENVLASALVET